MAGTDDEPLAALDRFVGELIAGRYRLDQRIAVGAMGAVFRGTDRHNLRSVAIKLLRPELANDEDATGRFAREVALCARLEHPNCLTVYDRGETTRGVPWMAMPLLEGHDLREALRQPIPLARAVDLARQLFRGLDHVHARGIVHRDIKPANLFLTRDRDGSERLKIIDYGIARATDYESAGYRTKFGIVVGTPMYMSPEQVAGKRSDERSDLYSAGLVFYEMLSGTRPFKAGEVVRSIRRNQTARLAPLPTSVPPVLAAIVQELVGKDRDRRVQTAREALDWIEGAAAMVWPDGGVSREIRVTRSAPPTTPVDTFRSSSPSHVDRLGDALDVLLGMSTGRAADQLADQLVPTAAALGFLGDDSDSGRTPTPRWCSDSGS